MDAQELIQVLQDEISNLPKPDLKGAKFEYWKAGAREVIAAVNRAISTANKRTAIGNVLLNKCKDSKP